MGLWISSRLSGSVSDPGEVVLEGATPLPEGVLVANLWV